MSADNYTTCPRCGDTFREYYEFFGADEGTVAWNYIGQCYSCGLTTNFSGSHQFYPEKEA